MEPARGGGRTGRGGGRGRARGTRAGRGKTGPAEGPAKRQVASSAEAGGLAKRQQATSSTEVGAVAKQQATAAGSLRPPSPIANPEPLDSRIAAACLGKLELAIESKQEAAVRWLLQHGADPSLPNSTGFTPLMAAASNGSLTFVQLLLVKGAAVNATETGLGLTAFHYACCSGNVECVEALMTAGCDTGARSKNGVTGRGMAAHLGHTALVERLDSVPKHDTS